ncbi:MAG: helix-turn-helix transcriptional regulator [Burkholderiales bacterium]|mgnify:CR=1 FL=1|nr:helix-turn-helix transcriptional regulator [Burkholderiales bacterium]
MIGQGEREQAGECASRRTAGACALLAEGIDQAVSRLLIGLYRGVTDEPATTFCSSAFQQLRALLAFDSAMWGYGRGDPIFFDDVHLEDQPTEILRSYVQHRRSDAFAAHTAASAGRAVDLYDVFTRDDFVGSPLYRHHAKRFGIEHALSMQLHDADSGLEHVVSLWRADYSRPFTPGERAAMQFVVPHLIEARRQNLFTRLREASAGSVVRHGGSAVCDDKGLLHQFEDRWLELLRRHWPQWSGPHLPPELARLSRRSANGSASIGDLVCGWSPLGTRVLLQLRPQMPADRLTRRERQVARLLHEGHTYKSIAQQMQVTPNTVRAHMYTLYRKLGVNNKAQMLLAWSATQRADAAG